MEAMDVSMVIPVYDDEDTPMLHLIQRVEDPKVLAEFVQENRRIRKDKAEALEKLKGEVKRLEEEKQKKDTPSALSDEQERFAQILELGEQKLMSNCNKENIDEVISTFHRELGITVRSLTEQEAHQLETLCRQGKRGTLEQCASLMIHQARKVVLEADINKAVEKAKRKAKRKEERAQRRAQKRQNKEEGEVSAHETTDTDSDEADTEPEITPEKGGEETSPGEVQHMDTTEAPANPDPV